MLKKRTEKGFSLIETAIGLAVFGIISAVILSSLAMTTRSNITNSNLTQAESMARTQMESFLSQPYSAADNYTVISPTPNGYSFVTPMVVPIDTTGAVITGDDGLQKITVAVKYNNNIIYTISDYKVNK